MSNSQVRMKLLIDTKGKRVLFAEAGKDCVDFLFHILSLPVATIIHLLKAQDQEMVGSLPNLYKSLETLNDAYILPNQKKDTYLKPIPPVSSSSVPLLALPDPDQLHKELYRCRTCVNPKYLSNDPRATCPSCHRHLTVSVTYVAPKEGGLVKDVVTYMVMDDLMIMPMSIITCVTMINSKFNIKDVGALEEKVVTFGMDETLKLLKASMESNKVLTDVFF